MPYVGDTSMNKTGPIFKNSQSSEGHKYLKIILPRGKCKIFLGLYGGYYGSTSKGVPNQDVREVVGEDVREGFLKEITESQRE